VDEELEAPLPKRCPKCGGAIGQCRVEEQYQSEIVRKTHVIRFRVHVGACNDCGARVQGRHPQQTSDALGAAVSHLGPDAVALATLLNKQVGTSVAKTAAILQQTFGLRVTPGGVSHAVARVGRKCAPTYERLKQGIRASASVTLDDTGWKVGGSPHWLFAAATAAATAFAIAARRGHAEAATLLGADFDGFLVRDGAAIYRLFEQADQQVDRRRSRRAARRRGRRIADEAAAQEDAPPPEALSAPLTPNGCQPPERNPTRRTRASPPSTGRTA
jgi:transposase